MVLNLDQIQNRENIFEIIDKFTNLKSDSNTFSDFLIYAQISFNSDTQNLIREIFKKYEFILDKIIVLPAKDNKNEVLNLSDVKQNYGNNCSWALHTHVYDAESNLLLCEETALQKWDFNKASIQDINNSRGVMPVCNSCKMKTRLNGFYDTKNLFIQNSCNHKSLLLNLIFNEIADYYFSEHNYGLFEYKKNIEKLSELGMLPEFFSTKKVLIIYTAGKLIALKRFDDALYLLELILKFDPSNPEIHDILEKLSESL
ncbi:MAG: hypothetical protein ACD_79C00753G0001 [uncultured bacterium]|nr:MAG: hypothetical protein ACD_79C00753G0001 [uncultured bacterium]